jgi:hypothetical protein
VGRVLTLDRARTSATVQRVKEARHSVANAASLREHHNTPHIALSCKIRMSSTRTPLAAEHPA